MGKEPASLFRYLISLIYWFNPALLALWIACIWSLFAWKYKEQESRDLKMIAVFGWSILLGYMVIRGMTETNPQYQYPAIPRALTHIGSPLSAARRSNPQGQPRMVS